MTRRKRRRVREEEKKYMYIYNRETDRQTGRQTEPYGQAGRAMECIHTTT